MKWTNLDEDWEDELYVRQNRKKRLPKMKDVDKSKEIKKKEKNWKKR